jgi:hypothetical protein
MEYFTQAGLVSAISEKHQQEHTRLQSIKRSTVNTSGAN